MIDCMIRSTPDSPQRAIEDWKIDYRIAGDQETREGAFRLVYDAYVKSGLARPNRSAMRILPHQLLPTTDIFAALSHGEVISTVSLVGDASEGMPIDSAYGGVATRLRRMGRVLGEVSCLACRSDAPQQCFMELFRLMAQAARYRGIDALIVAVHPRHAKFYERYLAFQVVGEEVCYPAVCDRPAVALLLDLDRVERERPARYARFFGEPLPAPTLTSHPMSNSQQRHFRRLMHMEEAESRTINHILNLDCCAQGAVVMAGAAS